MPKPNHGKANAPLIKRIKRVKDLCNVLIAYSLKHPLVSEIPPAELEELYLLLDSNVTTGRAYLANRTKVPVWTQPILINAEQTSGGIREAARLFFDHVKSVHMLNPEQALSTKLAELDALIASNTPKATDKDAATALRRLEPIRREREKLGRKVKQKTLSYRRVRQIVCGDVPDYCAALEPTGEDHARSRGYYGQPCPQCGGYRTTEAPDASRLKCLRCSSSNVFTFAKEPRYSCPGCHWWLTREEGAAMPPEGLPCPACGAQIMPIGKIGNSVI